MSSPHLEITQMKKKIYSQEFQWKGRIYPIAQDAIWFDKKGIGHLHVEVNESDGTMRFLYNQKLERDDKCEACGGKTSIDAKNVKDLVKRKTINTYWGIDNSYTLLLLILAIVLVLAIAGIFYLVGDNQATHELLNKYLQPVPTANPNNANAPQLKFIIGVLLWQ